MVPPPSAQRQRTSNQYSPLVRLSRRSKRSQDLPTSATGPIFMALESVRVRSSRRWSSPKGLAQTKVFATSFNGRENMLYSWQNVLRQPSQDVRIHNTSCFLDLRHAHWLRPRLDPTIRHSICNATLLSMRSAEQSLYRALAQRARPRALRRRSDRGAPSPALTPMREIAEPHEDCFSCKDGGLCFALSLHHSFYHPITAGEGDSN
jgi:hypothetical protein